MGRLCTLFTGQWADLSLDDLSRKAKDFGYDGLELACWGDHFEVDKALAEDDYCAKKREFLESRDLQCQAISNHLAGQAVLDIIDERSQAILPPYVWGDGDPAGVNERAAEFARRLTRDAPGGPADRVRLALHLTTGRAPSDEEIAADVKFLDELQNEEELTAGRALECYCLTLLNTNAFIYLD